MELERKRISRDGMFSQIVRVVAMRSTCHRSQVGALIVKNGRIVSMGYNGPAAGMPACERIPDEFRTYSSIYIDNWKKTHPNKCMGAGCDRSIHAEMNAIAFAARDGIAVEGCTLYCSMSPCINCAKVIVNSGIKKVVYMEEYRDKTGIEFLKRAGIETTLYDYFKEG